HYPHLSHLSSTLHIILSLFSPLFFSNDTSTTDIYTLSLHDALPILNRINLVLPLTIFNLVTEVINLVGFLSKDTEDNVNHSVSRDRKSTRLNSSHDQISYAVFCLKKKKKKEIKRKNKKKHMNIQINI